MSAYGDLAASGQIRLLKLDDVQPNLDLSGTLRVVNLSDLPNYYAVSYTWGSPKDSKQILISGIAYTIRKNLWECLHALMHNFEHLRGSWLWADALCIRQDCVEEKNRQVSQIHHVFAGAEHVYAWLGKDPQVEQSLSCFPTSLDELAPTKETYRHAVLIHTEPNFVMRTKVNTEPWEAVAFCSYFTRTWVVQECALAKALTFVCGQITWYVRHDDLLPTACKEWALRRLLFTRWVLQPGHWRSPERLLQVIWDFRMTMCDEPRDIVFALQSIAEPLTRCVVDYQIAPCDLFWQVILADTERNLMEHQATNLQKVLKTSWDDITSSVDCMAASRSRRPCIRVKLSRKYPRVGHPTSEVPELDGEANDTRLVAFQSDHYGEEYQGSGAFHLWYDGRRRYVLDCRVWVRCTDHHPDHGKRFFQALWACPSSRC